MGPGDSLIHFRIKQRRPFKRWLRCPDLLCGTIEPLNNFFLLNKDDLPKGGWDGRPPSGTDDSFIHFRLKTKTTFQRVVQLAGSVVGLVTHLLIFHFKTKTNSQRVVELAGSVVGLGTHLLIFLFKTKTTFERVVELAAPLWDLVTHLLSFLFETKTTFDRVVELAGPVAGLVTPWTYRCDASNSSLGGHYPGPRLEDFMLENKAFSSIILSYRVAWNLQY